MLAVTRKAKIKEIVLENKSVTVANLATTFNVTEETIRRDLKALEDEGILIRTYGGAYIQEGVQNDINVNIREQLYIENKELIATKCVPHIMHGDSIFLDASTTSLHIAKKILDLRVTVITNSLKVAYVLSESPNVRFIMIGGMFAPNSMSFVGKNAIDNIMNYYVDKAFISCRSVSMEFGVTDSNEQQAEVRATALKRSNKAFLIVDNTKFNKTSFVNICTFDDIDFVVTDQPLEAKWHDYLSERQVTCID